MSPSLRQGPRAAKSLLIFLIPPALPRGFSSGSLHSENQIQTQISQHSLGGRHDLALASLSDLISSDGSPFYHVPATLALSRLQPCYSLCLILFLPFLASPALCCHSMSSQHVLFSKTSSLTTFGKTAPSSQPLSSLYPVSLITIKKDPK